jgi:hypothetical protein
VNLKDIHIGGINFAFKLVYDNVLNCVIITIIIEMFKMWLKEDSHVTLLRFGVVEKYA